MTQPREHTLTRTQIADALAGIGVDDLAKFRIASHLLTMPGVPRSPAQIAESLGFRSAERTNVALDQMAQAGILRSVRGIDGTVCYEMPLEAVVKLRATGAFGIGFQLPGAAIHALADRSLARIRSTRRWIRREPIPSAETAESLHA